MLVQRTLALGLAIAGANAASGTGKTTRYWDCCKPSCSWSDKAAFNRPVLTCDKNDNPITDANARSGCEGGPAYTCFNNAPWRINDDLAFGFAATNIQGGTEKSWCCACYAMKFTSGPASGKTMVVQSTNTGGDLGTNHFDILMPGGGVGIFDGCTSEFGGIPGERYGGIKDKSECAKMPKGLQAGCEWRFEWFGNSDNPEMEFEQVQCPQELVERSGCKRDDDSSFPAFNAPSGSGGGSSGGSNGGSDGGSSGGSDGGSNGGQAPSPSQEPESSIQAPATTATPEPQGQTPEPQGQTPEPQGQTPEPQGQTPEPQGQTPEPQNQTPEPPKNSPKPVSNCKRSRRH